jgi:hypothetical protein
MLVRATVKGEIVCPPDAPILVNSNQNMFMDAIGEGLQQEFHASPSAGQL